MRGAEGVHQAADRGAFLGHRDEQLAGAAVGEEADGDVALVAVDVELVGDDSAACRAAVRGAAWARRRSRPRRVSPSVLGGERLAFLRAVAVDRQGLEAELPAFEVRLGDVLDVASRGMLTVFEIAPERNGWAAAIIRTWARQAIAALAVARLERTVEDGAGARPSSRAPLRSCRARRCSRGSRRFRARRSRAS